MSAAKVLLRSMPRPSRPNKGGVGEGSNGAERDLLVLDLLVVDAVYTLKVAAQRGGLYPSRRVGETGTPFAFAARRGSSMRSTRRRSLSGGVHSFVPVGVGCISVSPDFLSLSFPVFPPSPTLEQVGIAHRTKGGDYCGCQ